MSEAGFRVKEERQLEVHGGLIGEYRKGLFEAVSNFAVKPVGLVRDSINGYTWIAVFPKKKKKTRFFVPCSDYTRPSRFVAHLQEQYPFQVSLSCESGESRCNLLKRGVDTPERSRGIKTP